MENTSFEIKQADYHRNGVSGSPFVVALFTFTEGNQTFNMMGVMFEDSFPCNEKPGVFKCPRVAVFDTDKIAQGTVKFTENSWRGDHFVGVMREAYELAFEKFNPENA